ncbi:Crustacean hyperglycemic hormone, partial [Armadillidium vulgare]
CRGVDNLGLEDFVPAGMKAKRRIFDTSCKGFYDRGLFAQLDRVCEDCYNLYRKPHVAAECSIYLVFVALHPTLSAS